MSKSIESNILPASVNDESKNSLLSGDETESLDLTSELNELSKELYEERSSDRNGKGKYQTSKSIQVDYTGDDNSLHEQRNFFGIFF